VCLGKEKGVGVVLLPWLFVTLWRGCFGLGSGHGAGAVPAGMQPRGAPSCRAGQPAGSSWGALTARPAAGREAPSEELEAEDAKSVVGSGSAPARLGQLPRGTAELKSSSRLAGRLPARLPAWHFPTGLFSRQPEPRPCCCAAPELALSTGG